MIARGMNRNGMPLFPVTREDAAWPPATAVSGADAATMKNTRSRVPSARRCNWLPAELSAAVVDDDGPAGGSMMDMDVLPSMRRRPRRLVVLRCSPPLHVVLGEVDVTQRLPREGSARHQR